MSDRKLLVVMLIIWAIGMAGTFTYNLPNWCANPGLPGNWLIVPFCK